MFVRYLTEKQVLSLGFTPAHEANLCSETFSLSKFNHEYDFHTLISLYDNTSSFLYKIVTYEESTIAEGMITRFDDLKKMVKKYMDDDILTFMERKRGEPFTEIEKTYLRRKLNVNAESR